MDLLNSLLDYFRVRLLESDCYNVGMGKHVASTLVLRHDIFNIVSHGCLLVLCAQRGRPCLEAEAGEELGWELLPHLFFWSVGREYDGIAVEVVHRALRVGEMPALISLRTRASAMR